MRRCSRPPRAGVGTRPRRLRCRRDPNPAGSTRALRCRARRRRRSRRTPPSRSVPRRGHARGQFARRHESRVPVDEVRSAGRVDDQVGAVGLAVGDDPLVRPPPQPCRALVVGLQRTLNLSARAASSARTGSANGPVVQGTERLASACSRIDRDGSRGRRGPGARPGRAGHRYGRGRRASPSAAARPSSRSCRTNSTSPRRTASRSPRSARRAGVSAHRCRRAAARARTRARRRAVRPQCGTHDRAPRRSSPRARRPTKASPARQ